MAKNSYYGFSGKDRSKKSAERRRLTKAGRFPWKPKPHCELCGEKRDDIRFHSEDYSQPYSWKAPAVRSLCKQCHSAVHARFKKPDFWMRLVAHVSRGGYASELRAYRKQLDAWQAAVAYGCTCELPRIPGRRVRGEDRWIQLPLA